MGIKEDFMVGEAVERLNLMGAHYMETSKILFERQYEVSHLCVKGGDANAGI